MKLEIEISDEDWKRYVKERRSEIGEEYTEKEIKESFECDLANKLAEWYPKNKRR